jgi:hypothetical protein
VVLIPSLPFGLSGGKYGHSGSPEAASKRERTQIARVIRRSITPGSSPATVEPGPGLPCSEGRQAQLESGIFCARNVDDLTRS